MKLTGRDWVLVAVALAVAGLCMRLGVWQLDRLSQRRARNAQTAAALAQPPFDLNASPVLPDSAVRRRLRARGVYDFARERTGPGRLIDGQPGVAVLTPLDLGDGRAIVVERGLAVSPDGREIDLRQYRELDTADVIGLAVSLPLAAFTDSLRYALLPFGLQVVESDAATMLRRLPLPALDDGPHKGYALQWFSFATIVLVGTAVLLRQQHRRRVT